MARLALLVGSLLLACTGPEATDAGRPDAPRPPDAGFDPAALEPCTADPSMAFDGEGYAGHPWLEVSPTARRLFYPLAVIAADGTADAPGDVAVSRRAATTDAAACAGDVACVRAAIGYDAEAAQAAGLAIAEALVGEHLTSVAEHLRGSGTCAGIDAADDAALVASCIEDLLLELTAALAILDGAEPAALDARVQPIAASAETAPFFEPITALLEQGLLLADRSEPVRYEPLDEENAAAIAALATTDFAAFAFGAIVVPGQGPNDAETALHPAGRARADLGYDRWAAGLAPVILVTGGHVHPDRTVYSEAVEMRRYLVEARGMPVSAVMIDPYARHTTTNLRNATRILVRAGVPTDAPLLVTSDVLQSAYIASVGFATRCDEELSFRPFVALQRLSPFDACWLPVEASLGLAPSDPLDP